MTFAFCVISSALRISTHTLTWSVTLHLTRTNSNILISTHTLTWSVTQLSSLSACRYNHFNSHAHVERDSAIYANMAVLPISTHTLTWSVTGWKLAYIRRFDISTHTLTWSVTVAGKEVEYLVGNFNSHAHVERDKPLCHHITHKCLFQLTRSRGA